MLKENEDMTEETNDEGTQGKLESSEEKSFGSEISFLGNYSGLIFYIGTTKYQGGVLITFNTFMLN